MTDPPRVPSTRAALTRAALARRYGVDRSAITHALAAAAKAHARDPQHSPAPPRPDSDESPEQFDVAQFDVFWDNRPRRGRPRKPTTATGETHVGLRPN